MPFVIAAPDLLATTATDLERIGAAISAGNYAAAAPDHQRGRGSGRRDIGGNRGGVRCAWSELSGSQRPDDRVP
ncbi:PE family protein [Mycobacterium gastri]|uniref:PE family protein n=1 Tax=Mycobacterium gastri TaxID=1777 RepID=UPI00111BF804